MKQIPDPYVPAGSLVTNNTAQVGITNFTGVNVTDFSLGSIGKGLSCFDLSPTYNAKLGEANIKISASSDGPIRCAPEPATLSLTTLLAFGVIARRNAYHT